MDSVNVDGLTDDKAKWIEEQVNKMFAFSLETRRLLTADAHTTVNWMLGIVLGSFGYVVSLAKAPGPTPVWMWLPLVVVIAGVCGLGTWFYFRAMRVTPVHSPGNSPEPLLAPGFIEFSLPDMRIADCRGIDARTAETRDENKKLGRAINLARLWMLLIPALAVLASAITYAFT